jgi:hypothetical protein
MTDTPQPTDRQLAALTDLVSEAQKVYSVECPRWGHFNGWVTTFADEVRPGRGHDLSAVYVDSDHIVQIMVDVYGNGSLSVGDVDWIHNSSDEDCRCDPCQDRRREENGE